MKKYFEHKWDNTACEFLNNEENRSIIQFLEKEGLGGWSSDKNNYIIYAAEGSGVLFYADSYIENTKHFQDLIKYFKDVDFSRKLKIIMSDFEQRFEEKNLSDEIEKYKSILTNNNINNNLGYLTNDISNISVNLLQGLHKQTDKNKKLRKVYILMMLSEYTEIKGNEFNFRIEQSGGGASISYDFDTCGIEDIEILDSVYNWIINEKGYENTYKEKLEVIRSVLVRNNSLELNSDKNNSILDSAKSIFQKIIKQETNRYFEEVNQLKNDFLTITERENDIYQSLHLKLLGWFSAVALTIFDKISNYEGNNIIHKLINSNSEKTRLVLAMLIIALIIIFTLYFLETRKNQDEFLKLKKFYVQSLMFNDNDFQNKVEFPEINQKYLIVAILLTLVLLLRLFLSGCHYILIAVIIVIIVCIGYKYGFIECITNSINKSSKLGYEE